MHNVLLRTFASTIILYMCFCMAFMAIVAQFRRVKLCKSACLEACAKCGIYMYYVRAMESNSMRTWHMLFSLTFLTTLAS